MGKGGYMMCYMKDVMWLDEYLNEREDIQAMIQSKIYYLKSNKPTYVTLVLTDLALYVIDSSGPRLRMERYLYKEMSSIVVNINAPGDVHGMTHVSLYQGNQHRFLLLLEASELISFSKFAEALSNHVVSRQGKRDTITGAGVLEMLARERKRKFFN